MASDTKLFILTLNQGNEFFLIESPSSYNNSELCIQKSRVQQNVFLIEEVSRSAGTGKGVRIMLW